MSTSATLDHNLAPADAQALASVDAVVALFARLGYGTSVWDSAPRPCSDMTTDAL